MGGLVAVLGTAMTTASKSHAPNFDLEMVSHLIQKAQNNKAMPRTLSSGCGPKMEVKLVSAVAVVLLKEVICEKQGFADECEVFTRVAEKLEDGITPPCSSDSMKCTKEDDSICVLRECADDIEQLPAHKQPHCEH